MTSAFSIYAGTVDDVRPDSGDWVIVDLSISEADAGLTESGATCCVYRPGGDLHESTFGEAANLIIEAAGEAGQPLNLLIEAPLSAAFDKGLNPIPRSIERRFFQGRNQVRAWHFRTGAVPLLSAMTLLRLVSRSTLARDVRLFEGFGAFEWAGAPGEEVVLALWAAVRGRDRQRIRGPETLVSGEDDILLPAFTIDGTDIGIPPVILA